MAQHDIPRSDGDLESWSENFGNMVSELFDVVGLTFAQQAAIQTVITNWHSAYVSHVGMQQAAQAATESKDAARRALEDVVRPLIRIMQTYPATTDAQRAFLGITVPDRIRTEAADPVTRPLVSVEVPARLLHEIRVSDEGAPTAASRPRGTRGAQLWEALTGPGVTAPPPMDAFRYTGEATKRLTRRQFKAEDGGKTAHYQLRWVSTRGGTGPWSEVASATVAA